MNHRPLNFNLKNPFSILCTRYVGYALTTKWEGSGEKMQVIGFDMGGTSTDVSRFAGTFEHVFESTTAGAAFCRLLYRWCKLLISCVGYSD